LVQSNAKYRSSDKWKRRRFAARAHGYFALFYKREHAGQGVFDGFRATIINIAPKSDRIGTSRQQVAPASSNSRNRKVLSAAFGKASGSLRHAPSHGENMGCALD